MNSNEICKADDFEDFVCSRAAFDGSRDVGADNMFVDRSCAGSDGNVDELLDFGR